MREMQTRMQRDKLEPEEIAFVSFSKNAVQEMTTRMGLEAARTPHWKTIHALGLAAIGRTDARVADDYVQHRFLREYASNESDPLRFEMRTALALGALSEARCEPLSVTYERAGRHHSYGYDRMRQWWHEWLAYCDAQRLLRFGAMLTRALRRPSSLLADVRLVVVDEAADTSRAQLRLLQHLIPPRAEIVVAGDDDQAIYEGLGALGLDAMRAWPDAREEVLGHTYRLPDVIMQAAGREIRRVRARRFKPCTPRTFDDGHVVRVPSLDAVSVPETGSVLLLARRRQTLPVLERMVEECARTYRNRDGAWAHEHTLVHAAQAWTRLQHGRPVDAVGVSALQKHVNPALWAVPRGQVRVARSDVPEALRARPWHEVLTQQVSVRHVNYVRGMLARVDGRVQALVRDARVRVTTIHDAKGTEADHVVVLDAPGRWLREMAESSSEVRDAETRVRYVGMTRARMSLTVVGGA
jgi:DNA helicase-2/ATP-dependent DNA helicase PcrA